MFPGELNVDIVESYPLAFDFVYLFQKNLICSSFWLVDRSPHKIFLMYTSFCKVDWSGTTLSILLHICWFDLPPQKFCDVFMLLKCIV